MEQKLEDLMAEILPSKLEVDKQLAKLKHEMATAQGKTSLNLARKMSSSLYQFKTKSHEHHYHFNTGLSDTLDSAKAELGQLKPTTMENKSTLQIVQGLLDKV